MHLCNSALDHTWKNWKKKEQGTITWVCQDTGQDSTAGVYKEKFAGYQLKEAGQDYQYYTQWLLIP